jgi:hypothetical protein
MKNRKSVWRVVAAVGALMLLTSCATLMKMPLFGITVQVTDEANAPIAGAIVESSDGQQATTGADGSAALKFGSLGVHMITVMAQNRAPASFSVTMPLDSGKTMPARLGKQVEMSANINVRSNASVGANLGGLGLGMLYPMIFQSMFTAYGYNMELAPYNPGDWTEWGFHSEKRKKKHDMVMRKAFLTKLDNKQEWWQVQLNFEEKDNAMAFEVLFSAERQSIRRMRQKSGDGGAGEVPVSEGWYSAPMQLTPESIEGAVTRKGEEVTVPAGKFKADLLEFAYMGSGIKVRMWRAKGVPGGVVRAELVKEGEEPVWVSELKAHGSGAKTILGSY